MAASKIRMQAFRGTSDEQLSLTLRDTEKHLFQLRFQSATDRLETPSEIRKAKRDIARIKTVQRERELQTLRSLSPKELASRVANLERKVQEQQPGKRQAYRRMKRLKTLLGVPGSPGVIAEPRQARHPKSKRTSGRRRRVRNFITYDQAKGEVANWLRSHQEKVLIDVRTVLHDLEVTSRAAGVVASALNALVASGDLRHAYKVEVKGRLLDQEFDSPLDVPDDLEGLIVPCYRVAEVAGAASQK